MTPHDAAADLAATCKIRDLNEADTRHQIIDRIGRIEGLLRVCAVKRWRFPAGASPARQPLQPEATGAVMEVTKWLKPLVMRVTNR
jgi:hypothetical protein